MSDFKNYLKNKGLSKTTREAYHYHAMNFLVFLDKDNTEVDVCTSKEVLLYLSYLQKTGLTNETRKVRLYALKHFFKFLIDSGQRDEDPTARITIRGAVHQKLTPVLSKQELQSLWSNYEVPQSDDKRSHHNWFKTYRLSRERNKVILSFLIHQGITTAEVGRLQLSDVNLRQGEITIRGGRMLKDRVLPLQANQIMDVMEYQYQTRAELTEYHLPNINYLFLSTPSSGAKLATGNGKLQIWKGLTKDLRKQQSGFINISQIRTSVITHWLKHHNLRQVQYKAGHKNLYSTEMYLANEIEDLQKEVDKFHPMG